LQIPAESEIQTKHLSKFDRYNIFMAENKLQSLVEIFNQKFFRIPDFQRGYAWQEEHLIDF